MLAVELEVFTVSDTQLTVGMSLFLSGSSIEVFLGRQTQNGSNPNEVSRMVNETRCHPDYNSFTSDNDICLLKLSAPVDFTDYIRPICLASHNSTFYNGTSSWVTGWGALVQGGSSPDILQEVNVPIVGNNRCQCNYNENGITITANMICAGLREGGRDSCQGDSGGPMVSESDNRWVQSGVVSFGVGCALPRLPGVYARVSRYQDWINNVIVSNRPMFVTFTSDMNPEMNISCARPTFPPFTTDDSIFGAGENVVAHFTSIFLLVLSVFVLGEA